MAITPGVKTRVRFGIEQRAVTVRAWHYRRDAQDIGRGRLRGAEPSTGVQKTGGGDAWILREKYSELAQLRKTVNEADVLRAVDVNLAPGVIAVDTFHRNDDLTGLGTSGSVVATGITAFRKRPGAGSVWSDQVLAGAIPAPDPDADAEQTVPLDRILEGKVSYPENCPFLVWLRLPPDEDLGQDGLCNFYFGGAASVTPQEAEGGRFCLTVRGNGQAVLHEWKTPEGVEDPWQVRHRFSLTNDVLGNTIFLLITPYGRDRLWVRSFNTVEGGSGGFGGGALVTIASLAIRADQYAKHGLPQSLYVNRQASTGHHKVRTCTGAGLVMLDHRREPRADVTIVRGKYVATGNLTDGPFSIPRDTPAATPIRLEVDSYLIPNGVISAGLYDASTHVALSTDADGNFLTNAGQWSYYARLTLTTVDGVQTPVVRGYNADIEPQFGAASGVPLSAPTWGTQVTGPDIEPDHETASFTIKDRRGTYALLRVQDRIRSTISLVDSVSGAVISHLMEGETLQIHAKKRGNASHLANWYDYDGRLVGMWAKLRRQFYQSGLLDALQDPNAPIDPETLEKENPFPWKVTDWLTRVLLECGVPEDEIDIPDSSIRFWSAENSEDLLLQYGTDLAALAAKLAKDYLGRVFLRDPNAGTRGMWRTLVTPQAPYTNSLATLYHERPSAAGHPALRRDAFGAGTALIEADSWVTWPVGPEFTHLLVRGVGRAEDGGDGRLERELITPGWDNPASPNYTAGEIIPFSHGPDTGLQTQEAVDWQARTLMRLAGTAQKWFRCRSALLLIDNPLDTLQTLLRPLRVNDVITLVTEAGTYTALVRSCDPVKDTHSDGFWKQDVSGIIVA